MSFNYVTFGDYTIFGFKPTRMPIKLTLLTLATILFISSFSAQTKLDSLINIIDQSKELKRDTNLYHMYYDVIKATFNTDLDTCKHFVDKSLLLAQDLDFKPGVQKSAYMLANVFRNQGKYEEAIKPLNICIGALPSALTRHSRCLKIMGDIYRRKSDFEETKKYYDLAEQAGEEAKDTSFLASVYNSRAIMYEDLEQVDNAVDNYLRSAQIRKEQKNIRGYFRSMNNIVGFYLNNLDFEKAKYYLNELKTEIPSPTDLQRSAILSKESTIYENEDQIEKALETMQEALEYSLKAKHVETIGSNYFNVGLYHLELEQFDEAYRALNKGLDYVRSELRKFNYYNALALVEINQGECTGAKKWIDKAGSIRENIKRYDYLRKYHSTVNKYYACKGNYELAIKAIDSSFIFSDSMYFERKEFDAYKIEAKFQNRIKQDSINLLTIQSEKQSLKISRRNIGLGTTSIILLLLGFLARYYVKLSEKQKQLNSFLESKNEELIFENNELQKLNVQLEQKTKALADKHSPNTETKELSIHSNDKTYFVPMINIRYAHAEDDGIRVYFDDVSKWTKVSLKNFEQELEKDSFVRISRGTIVNVKHIAWINTNTLKMKAGAELKIGRVYKPKIKEILEA